MEWAGKDPTRQALAKAGLYGAFSNAGIDISRRVGMGDIVPTSPSNLAGPAISTVGRLITVMQKSHELTTPMIAELTGAIAPISKYLYHAYEGESIDPTNRDRLKYRYTPSERLALAFAFAPTGETVERDKNSIIRVSTQAAKDYKAEAIDKYLANRTTENLKKARELGATTEQIRNAKKAKGQPSVQRTIENLSKKDRREWANLNSFQ
jgi:hypothetical protein